MQKQIKTLEKINKLIRYWILEMTTRAGSGHPTSSLSAVELMTTLMFSGVFKFNIQDKNNPNNDRLIFSKGHASPLFYSLWVVANGIPAEELETYRQFGSRLEGHPTMKFPFTEVATGSLGQGLSVGLGMALASKKLEKTNARTFVLLGDSEMAEGQVWEAMEIASYYKLNNLIGIIDVNRLGQRGETMLGHDVETYKNRVESFGWNAVIVDGHNSEEIFSAFQNIDNSSDKPTMIIAKAIKGKGVSFIEDQNDWHGKVLNSNEFEKAKEELGEIDFEIRGEISLPEVENVSKQFEKTVITENLKNDENLDEIATSHSEVENFQLLHDDTNFKIGDLVATRDAYGTGLVKLMQEDKKVIVLDAETSNSTRADKAKKVFPERFFEMFIAEQNMASVASGLAARGYKPFVSSFAAFLTRAHGQIRMANLSDQNLVFVGSHAGVSIGEDGSSQMGLEDIAIFRSLLNSTVLYPSDAVSTEKLIKQASGNKNVTYIRTTREKTSVLYNSDEEFQIGGSKILRKSDNDKITVATAGITLFETLKAYDILKERGIMIRVIDLYSIKPIDVKTLSQAIKETGNILTVEDHYQEGGIGEAVRSALSNYVDTRLIVSVHSLFVNKMPQSGKIEELLAYEGIDCDAIVEKVEDFLTL
ncbi:MAG: transketolase [Candidatus Moranbacteria bacterium]|nr:transketolase [Candidatus Moranbacteria bacterium]